MKKFIFVIALIFCSVIAMAQSSALTYSEVIKKEGLSKAELYGGLREWVATSYRSGKAVTQMEDPATGVIILKANFPFKKGGIYSAYDGTVEYVLKLQAKDDRFKVEMSGITHQNKPGNAAHCSLGLITTDEKSGKGGLDKGSHNKIWKEVKEKSKAEFNYIVNSLNDWSSFNASEEEDW